MLQRVDAGDAQHVGDHAPRRGAAACGRYSLPAAEPGNVIDNEEVRGETEPLDGIKLVVEALERVGGKGLVEPRGPGEAELGQVGERRLAEGKVGHREQAAARPEVELAGVRDIAGAGYRLPRVMVRRRGEQSLHLRACFQVTPGVG